MGLGDPTAAQHLHGLPQSASQNPGGKGPFVPGAPPSSEVKVRLNTERRILEVRHMNQPVPAQAPDRPLSVTLASVETGTRVRVLDLAVERSIARRLADLGLTIGSHATVVQSSSTAVILAARGSRLAIGRPLAREIVVTIEPDGGTP